MTSKKKQPRYIIDELDAEAAISDIQSLMRNSGMSNTDLAVELGWSRMQVEDFLHGVDVPSKSEFDQVAKVLNYTLEF